MCCHVCYYYGKLAITAVIVGTGLLVQVLCLLLDSLSGLLSMAMMLDILSPAVLKQTVHDMKEANNVRNMRRCKLLSEDASIISGLFVSLCVAKTVLYLNLT